MTEPTQLLTQADILRILERQADAGNALVVAGLVDDCLQQLLLLAGRELSDKVAGNIFNGPLKYLKPKIEIAYMFELIDDPVRNDLRAIADIRNAFAHTSKHLDFGSAHIVQLCRQLSRWQRGADHQECYRNTALDCVNIMKRTMDRFLYAKALREPPPVGLAGSDD